MLSQSLLPEFDHEMATTRTVLSRVPDSALGWKPHAKSYSMLELATHTANVPAWIELTLEQSELDLDQTFETPNPASRDEVVSMFDAHVAAGRARIEAETDEVLMSPWTLRHGDHEIFTMPRVAVLRSFVMNHMIHHRGQLSVYLRLCDVPVPSIYGPSADEQTF